MIYSETIEIVFSEVVNNPVFSSEDQDYRRVEPLRLLENSDLRITEDDNKRLLE